MSAAGYSALLAAKHHMKSALTVAIDLAVAISLFSLGAGVCQGVGAPFWLLGLAEMPCLAYLRWRRWLSWRFVVSFVILFTASGIVLAIFMPRDMQHYSGGLVVLLLPGFMRSARPLSDESPNTQRIGRRRCERTSRPRSNVTLDPMRKVF